MFALAFAHICGLVLSLNTLALLGLLPDFLARYFPWGPLMGKKTRVLPSGIRREARKTELQVTDKVYDLTDVETNAEEIKLPPYNER